MLPILISYSLILMILCNVSFVVCFTKIEFASHRTAINVGKPSQTLLELLKLSNSKLAVERSVMVGDRLDTDIRFGMDHGMSSILVLTGVTNAKELRRIGAGTVEEPLPTAIISHVGAMASELDML
jgi:4-nitrophenyl phosphatase